jgi:hypothetical protein
MGLRGPAPRPTALRILERVTLASARLTEMSQSHV